MSGRASDARLTGESFGPILVGQEREERDQAARRNLADYALTLPEFDREPWLKEMLSALGLDGHETAMKPHPHMESISLTHQAEVAAKREADKAAAAEAHRSGRSWPRHIPAPCGTLSAYKRHVKKGEDVDDLCREAQRVASEARRAATPDGGVS